MPGFFDRSRHLVEGPGAIQLGMAPDALTPERVVRVFGHVFEPGHTPLMGARVEVLGAAGLGYTFTRADGRFDLLVNGGGDVTLRYTRPDHIESQRLVQVRAWHEYELADHVKLVPYDPEVTTIVASMSSAQVARGRVVDDGDGVRQATLIFPAGTGATAVMADGTRTPLGMLHMRLTELTVGAEGPSRMPGTMPRQIAYTYAVEVSADEAVTMGVASVELSQPAAFYLEYFIGMPVGGGVPAGYYDRQRGLWVPSDDGRVVEVMSVDAGGLAWLDLGGDAVAEDAAALSALGIDGEEQAEVGRPYAASAKLWRVPMTHFTPWDGNWGFAPTDSGNPPPDPGPLLANLGPGDGRGPGPHGGGGGDQGYGGGESCQRGGSILLCENQALAERFAVAGSGMSLRYQSNRAPGRREMLRVKLAVDPPPADHGTWSAGYEVKAIVAGRELPRSDGGHLTLEDGVHCASFSWDGLNTDGRRVT